MFEQNIIFMCVKGMSTRQICETIEEIYGFEFLEEFISDVIDKVLPLIEEWQIRALDEIYPILFNVPFTIQYVITVSSVRWQHM